MEREQRRDGWTDRAREVEEEMITEASRGARRSPQHDLHDLVGGGEARGDGAFRANSRKR
eukprot:338194-Hanusia_phi.AAC.1